MKTFAVPRLQNQSLLNAAYNLRAGGSGLTKGDLNYLNQLGLTNAGTRYAGKVESAQKQTAAGAVSGAAGIRQPIPAGV